MKEKHPSRKPSDSYSALISYIADPVVVINASGQALAANKATEKYTGIRNDELVGKRFFDQGFFSKKATAAIKKNLKKRISGHNIAPYEVQLGKNGKKAILEVNAKIIEHNDEMIDIVVFRDVTERDQQKKELEHDLQKSELNFKAVSDSAFDGIIIFDNKQVIRYWNPAAERIFGYEKNEVLGKTLQETIIPSSARGLIAKIKREIAQHPETVNRTLEFPCLKKEGTEFPTEISLSSVINGEELVVATIRDITERKNAEHSLKQQREILEAVTQNTGVGLTLITNDFKIFFANEWMKEKKGKDIVNKTCYTVLHNNQTDVCPTCPVKKIFNGENFALKEDLTVDPKGKQISAQITAIPVKDKNGKVFAALEVVVPTTQRKLMEKKVKEAEDLSRAMFEQTPLGVAIVDPETQAILQFNDIIHCQLDYTREEFSKLRLSDLEVHKNSRETQRRIKGAMIDGQTEFLTKHRTKTGKTRIVLVNERVIQLSDRKLLLLTCHDVTGINRMHDALRTSEEKFHTIANSVRDALVMVDHEGKITFWNRAAEKTFGYTDKEALGKAIHELAAPDSLSKEAKERIKQSIKTFSETGIGYFTVGTVEVKGHRKDNSEFPAELAVSPLKVGAKWHAVGLIKDISTRKLAEQQLKEAEQRYHALFDRAPLGVLVIDPNTLRCVEFNDVAHSQLGYSREEFEKITIPDFQAEKTAQQIHTHIQQFMREGGGEFETKHRTKTGEIRDVIVTIRVFQSDGKPYLHCICHDITEAKKIQNALIQSKERYRQLVETAQEGIWAIDNDFKTTLVNPHMTQMMGYSENEMIGRSLFDFIDPDRVGKIRGILQNYRLDAKGTYEYAFPRKDGSHVDTIVSLAEITNDQKQKTGILAVVSDISERKRTEKALKESEELSKAIVANSPIGIATSDNSYHFVTANEAFCKILGYTEAELRKLTFKDVSHPQELEKSVKNIRALEKGEIPAFINEKLYIKKDGTVIMGRVVVNSIRNAEGRPILFVVELEDITKRKQLEDDLRSSEERFRAISTSAMDAIILCDSNDKVLYWNPAAEKTFGYTYSQAFGKKLKDLVVPPEFHDNHTKFLKQLTITSTARRHFGLTAVKKDGSTFPIDLSVVSVVLNSQICFLTIIRDITEWKAMEEALRQERDMLESVATSTDMVLSIIGRDYRIIWANKMALKTTGCSHLEDRYCYETFGAGSPDVCEGCGVKRIFEKGENVVRRDYYRRTRDNRDVWVELISTPIKDKYGNVIAAVEIAVDITERKQLQNKLAEYSQRLEEIVQKRTNELKKTQAELVKSERLAAIGELAGMIGHDLRNPLTGIKNSAYIIKKKGSEMPTDQSREMLEVIDKCVDYSNRIINDLLDYSKEIRLSVEEVSPKKLLSDSLSMMEIPKKVQVKNKLKDTPTLKLDSDKIKRVFINLTKNSVDAMPEGGIIAVESREAKNGLEISFKDTGMGISDDILPRLFTPLLTTKAKGMGFGLAICKRIIEAHGGTIAVSTVKGQGTTFTLTLPFEPKTVKGGEKVWINIPESSLSTTTKLSERP